MQNGKLKVDKSIIQQKIKKITDKFVTFDEYGMEVKVQKSIVFEKREDAEKYAENKATELIKNLEDSIKELKEPIKFQVSSNLR